MIAIRTTISVIFFATGVLGAIYIAVWLGIVQPIFNVLDALSNDTLTVWTVAFSFLMFFVKEILAFLWFGLFMFLGQLVAWDEY